MCLFILAALAPLETRAQQTDYLSTGEAVGIATASLAVFGIGQLVKHGNADSDPRGIMPPRLDAKVSRFLGRRSGPGQKDTGDSKLGSGITVFGAAVGLALTDLSYSRYEKRKDLWQDQFLLMSGALATKGVTDLFKGLVSRRRPFLFFAPELAPQGESRRRPDDHYSFFSGHTSSAFFSMTFLNKRIRSAMRQEMSADGYRRHRWMSSTLTFGWASYVAFSRVRAYRHYFTDVLAGALAGYLMGELYYSFNDEPEVQPGSGGTPMAVTVSFTF